MLGERFRRPPAKARFTLEKRMSYLLADFREAGFANGSRGPT
jgi:hypothetical protein